MLRLVLRRLRAKRRDEGVALPVVIGIGLVTLTLVATSITLASSGLQAADTDQDRTGALNAAYAGVQDYLARLNGDSTYPLKGNPASTFNTGIGLTLPTGPSTNPAFGTGRAGTWAPVPNSTNGAAFRYEVDLSLYDYPLSGSVRLRATGRVGAVTSSVLATIKRSGFTDYAYFSNFEITDPALTGRGGTTPDASVNCNVYTWAGRNNGTCIGSLPRFDNTGVINGNLHSNDTIAMRCSRVNGTITTGDPGGNPSYNGGRNYNDDGNVGCEVLGPHTYPGLVPVPVTSVPIIAMPTSTGSMLSVASGSDPQSTTPPGCLYTGPTTVVYNSDGTMTVTSPWTKYTNTSGSGNPTSGSNPARCGLPGTGVGRLGNAGGARVNQLDKSLLYVQTVPLVPTDPNYASTAAAAVPAGLMCLGANGVLPVQGSAASAGWSFGTLGYPRPGEIPATYFGSGGNGVGVPAQWNTSAPVAYGCRNGDLFVKGTVGKAGSATGIQTTAASDNYTYITGDLVVADLTQDVLGLVASNAVIVWNPATWSLLLGTRSMLTDTDRAIQAAVMSVGHSFTVQNFDKGDPRGNLNVTGSITQYWKGKLRNAGFSYAANFTYDPLLATVTPPSFPAPTNATFTLSRYSYAPPAFNADGS